MAIAHDISTFPTRLHEDWRYFRLKPEELETRLNQAKLLDTPAIDPVDGTLIYEDTDNEPAVFGHNAFQVQADIFSDLVRRYARPQTVVIEQNANRFQPVHLEVNRDNGALIRDIRIVVQPDITAEVLIKLDPAAHQSLLNAEIRVLVLEGAALKLNLLAVGSPDSLSVLRLRGLVSESAELNVFNLQTGEGKIRSELDITLGGRGTNLTVDQAVIVNGNAFNDAVVKMVHAAPESNSDMNTITYAGDRGTAILNGLIHVKPMSENVQAYQTARNYILSDTAYSVGYPQLEIENQEVACSHGTTMHTFDESQLFYLASRGIPPVQAKAMILKGNIDYFFRNMNEENKERFLHHAYGKIEQLNL